MSEIALFNHTLHQHGTDHATPTDQTNLLHDFLSEFNL